MTRVPCSGCSDTAAILPALMPICLTASSPDSGSITRPFATTTSYEVGAEQAATSTNTTRATVERIHPPVVFVIPRREATRDLLSMSRAGYEVRKLDPLAVARDDNHDVTPKPSPRDTRSAIVAARRRACARSRESV